MNIFFNPAPEFLEESKKQIEEIRRKLPEFISEITAGRKVIFEDNSDLFRAVHSISGGSAFAGLKELESISWFLEKIITNIFSGKTESSLKIAEIIEKSIDLIETAVNNKGKVKKRDREQLEKQLEELLSDNKKTVSAKRAKKESADKKTDYISEENEYLSLNRKEKLEDTAHFNVMVSEKDMNEEEEEEISFNQYISFRIGSEHYAVPISYVYDMKEMMPCSRVPKQPSHYLGVTNLRGNIVPVIDFRSFLGVKDPCFNQYTVFLMLKIGEKVKGCVVDAINDVVVLEPENTHTTPSVSRKTNLEFVSFIAKDPKSGQFLIVLDVEKILKDD